MVEVLSNPDGTRGTATVSASGDGAVASASVSGETVTVEGSNGETVTVTTTTIETTTGGDAEGASGGDETGTASGDAVVADSESGENAPSSESGGNAPAESSGTLGDGLVDNPKRLSTVVIAGAASAGVLLMVVTALVCVWCARMRSARRLADEALKAGDADAYVPADPSYRQRERRDSTPWGHPSAAQR